MNKLLLTGIVFLWLQVDMLYAGEIKWTGAAGDSLWSSPANWNTGTLPGITDDVILDNLNGASSSYTVTLPAAGGIVVASITIVPLLPNTILLEIPLTATQLPAITLTKAGYGLVIYKGGVFRNHSGSTSGAAIVVNDSVMIKNGGRYLQQSRTTHAALVTKLSKAPGTEEGIFEFDIPGTTGYTISITGRTYGTLVLSASGGNRSYTSNGSSPLRINGDFIINTGVAYSIDLNNHIFIDGNFIHRGNSIDLASQSNNTVYNFNGHLYSAPGSVIKESAAGNPVIALSGFLNQQIDLRGTVENSIVFRLDNISSSLLHPLSLPYLLELKKGVIQSNNVNLLTLQAGCTIRADSLLTDSYVEGPLKKEGLNAASHFLFPVGKNRIQHWVALKSATGAFVVEYFRENPIALGNQIPASLHHLSSVEYWSIHAIGLPPTSAVVELSFIEPASGGINNLAHLRVAQFVNGSWVNQGNVATTGLAGISGSVLSETISDFSEGAKFFTLASSSVLNPLPVSLISWKGRPVSNGIAIEWEYEKSGLPDSIFLQKSADGIHFTTLQQIIVSPYKFWYQFIDPVNAAGTYFYRLQTVSNGLEEYSKIINVFYDDFSGISVNGQYRSGKWQVQIHAVLQKTIQIGLIDAGGKKYVSKKLLIEKGFHQYDIYEKPVSRGIYYLILQSEKGKLKTIPIMVY